MVPILPQFQLLRCMFGLKTGPKHANLLCFGVVSTITAVARAHNDTASKKLPGILQIIDWADPGAVATAPSPHTRAQLHQHKSSLRMNLRLRSTDVVLLCCGTGARQ